MSKSMPSQKTLINAAIASLFSISAAQAAQLNFSQLPPGTMAIPPAPNVIVSVDDSGSMNEKVGGGDNKTKMFRLKEALADVFSDTSLLPDGKIRLAWQVMHNNGNAPNAKNIIAGNVNSMKVLDSTHRAAFLSFANTLKPNSGTPSHRMMRQAYTYMKTGQSVNSPWAYKPGTTETPYLGCRRSYHIFMTDGAWNGYSNNELPGDSSNTTVQFPDGNVDNRTFTLPDGTVYSTSSDQTNVYRGKSFNLNNLLADWAMKMWAEDLQPSIPNNVTPSTTDGVPSTENYGSVALQRYWNPKHNPASWQHIVTYTIGYGTDAYSWPGEPAWSLADDDNYGAGGDFSKLVQGQASWKPTSFANLNPGNPAELWHMAINSRGKFYPTGPGRKYDLAQAFRLILEDINLQNTADVTSMVGSASTNIRTDLNRYTAGYEPKKWSGYVKSDTISTSGTASPDLNWGKTGGGQNITTANKLDARSYSTRVILSYNDALNKGVPFEWDSGTTKLSANQKSILNTDNNGEKRVNFLRGDRTNEGSLFRSRDSVQGDIINSNIWYVEHPSDNYSLSGYKSFVSSQKNRDPMIYVGGNDGMLHGFSAKDGTERIAYIPKAVYKELPKLSAPAYSHRFYVDGSPFSGDVDTSDKSASAPTSWKTLLVGSLGAGGKGYFVLDVTNPGTPTTPTSFTTTNADTLVVMDKTLHPSDTLTAGSDDEDIGHIFAAPVMDDNNPFKTNQIARLNNKRWAVIMGNGYNSKNERPVLLIQYLDGSMELKKIVATGTQVPHSPVDMSQDENVVGNGLSAPRLVDIDGNGTADIVYAGDIKGNLWKFDLLNTSDTLWGVATFGGNAMPLYTAVAPGGKRQPISAPPTVKANDQGAGGMMVAFGTGLNVTDADRTSTDIQSVYSVLDDTVYKINKTVTPNRLEIDPDKTNSAVSGVSDLVEQTMGSSTTGGGVSTGRTFWEMSNNAVDFDDKKGWYFNLQVSSERVLKPISFFDSSNILTIYSSTPAYGGNGTTGESCEPAGTPEKSYLTLMNIMNGKRPSVQIMDSNGDKLYSADDNNVSRMTLSPGAITSVVGKKEITLTGSDGKEDKLRRMPEQPMRPSWRQLQ